MKAKTYLFVAISLFSFIILTPDAFSQAHSQIEKITGSWTGRLKVQGMELRIVFNISFNQKDSLIVTLDSPDQGAKGITTSKSVLTNDSLIVKVKAIGGSYKGVFNAELNLLKGAWKQGGMVFPLDLERQEKQVELNRPQEPKPPFPYTEKEVVFKNNKAGIELAGTLTKPKEGGPYPKLCASRVFLVIFESDTQTRE